VLQLVGNFALIVIIIIVNTSTITVTDHAVCFDGIHTRAAAPTTCLYVSCVMAAYLHQQQFIKSASSDHELLDI
jgi:hypothetical protein